MVNYIETDNIKIWTDIRGVNRRGTILLCNGGPGSCDYLQPVSEMLEDEFSVIRFEQRGCGRSDSDGSYDIETAIKDIECIREYYNINMWIIGGHSWGANLAMIYAMKYPGRTQAVIYIAGNGFQRNREWSEEYHNNKDKSGELMPEFLYRSNDEVNRIGNICYKNFIQTPDLFRNIYNIECRILFMCAENDIRPNWPTEQLCNLSQNGELAIIKNAGHYIWLHQYDNMKTCLRNFFKLNM